MDDVEEKRVYGDRSGKADLLVAAAIGVLTVEVSVDRVGGFGVTRRCSPTDVAAGDGLVAVATEAGVLVRGPGDETFREAGFGPAVAVGVDDLGVVAAAPDGLVARLAAGRSDADDEDPVPDDGDAWADLGRLDAEVRAVDGDLLATASGVYRLPDLDYVGLDDVADVAAAGPLAATGDGLYSLGNGWLDELDGPFSVVASDGERAHAASAEDFFERRSRVWRPVALPAGGQVVDVTYGAVPFAVTDDGVLLAEREDGWEATSLGVAGVVGCAVAGRSGPGRA